MNLLLKKNETEWNLGGEHNKNIEKIGKNFDIKQIFHYLLKCVEGENIVRGVSFKEIFRDDFFKKYLKEYSDLSSFTHAGPYSDKIFNEFIKYEEQQKTLDNLLQDSFNLYKYSAINTFLFYSLLDNGLKDYYQKLNGIFLESR